MATKGRRLVLLLRLFSSLLSNW